PKYKFKNWKTTETRGIKVTNELRRKRSEEIVKELINHNKWKTHGRSLKIEDLERIGLKINYIDKGSELGDIVNRIQTIIWMLYNSTGIFKIFATEREKIFATATPISQVKKTPLRHGKMDVVKIQIKCEKCGEIHKIYAKFIPNPKIDQDLQKEGFVSFPKDAKLVCECGYEIDLTGIRNEIETKAKRKIIF
ncbi:unnamed protein product, partial [marine sediment metagenome]